MDMHNTLAFLVFPYIALAVFVVGHALRYLTDPYGWTAKSSQFLEKENLFLGATIFHWGVLLTLAGHAGGLLIPQRLFDAVGIDAGAHTAIAYYSGLAVGNAAFVGAVLLLLRRVFFRRIRATTTLNDVVTLSALVFVTGAGLYNVLFSHADVLYTVAPWIRGIVTFSPEPALMREVPLSYKVHILSAFALLAFSPFSRLVHIWSAPVGYFFRGWILFRRKILE